MSELETTEVSLEKPQLRPGISNEYLETAGVRPISAQEAEQLAGIPSCGLWIPYHYILGIPIVDNGRIYGRLRLDAPEDGHKYHQLAGTGMHAYLPKELSSMQPNGDLVLVEGEFKAMSLTEIGIPAIGLPGFYAVSKGKLLDEVSSAIAHLRPSRILYLGDRDTALNYQFADAVIKFAKAVAPTPVILPRIHLDSISKGIDDCREYLKENFQTWWNEAVSSAIPCSHKSTASDLCSLLLEAEKDNLARLTGENQTEAATKIARICAYMTKAPLVADRIADLANEYLKISKRAFNKAVKCEQSAMIAQMRESRKQSDANIKSATDFVSQYTGETDELVARYGQPVFIRTNQMGEITHLQVNQNYWAGLFGHENDVLFEPDEQEFYQYESINGLWIPVTDASITMQISQRLLKASRHPEYGLIEELRTERLLSSICKLAKGVTEKKDAFVRNKLHYIHVLNGIIQIGKDEIILREFSPKYYSRHQIPIKFNPDARCERFLDELVYPAVTPEDASLLQRWLGSVILHTNLAQRFLILEGDAGRGKSQLANIAQGLAGRQNCAGLRTEQLNERFELYRLRRKTLLAGADVPGRFLLTPGATVLKALVGGDYLDAEGKNLNANFPMKGDFNVVITCNERLRVRIENDTGAWRRRLLLINFNAPPPKRKIPNFAEYLLKEEGSGILNWALVGADALLREIRKFGDFALNDNQKKRVDSLLAESESLELFVRNCIRKSADSSLRKEQIIEAYGEYCAYKKWDPMSLNLVQKRLPELMLEVHSVSQSNSITVEELGRTRSARGYRGVELFQPK